VTREQRTVFGEVAERYEQTRPTYPTALFDQILAFGDLHAGDRALEIGAGTGKATHAMLERDLRVTALEPSPGMATVLRNTGVPVVETTFEDWTVEHGAFDLVYAAQAWHWVDDAIGYPTVAAALRSGGTVALFWNQPEEWDGELGRDIDAVYAAHAPSLLRASEQWDLDATIEQLETRGDFEAVTKLTVPWTQAYTTDEYVALMGTHSNHRMLDDDVRARLHDALGAVVAHHGGRVEVVYNADAYLARRR
jgi:SAM-dependent methyltransferase